MRSLSFGLFAAATLGIAAPANAAPAPHHAPPAVRFHAAPAPAFRFHPRPVVAARIAPPAVRFHHRPVVGVVPVPVPAPVVVWNDWDWPPAVWETDYAYAPACHIVRERIKVKRKIVVREREVCD
jgi:hypothetical protein